MLGAEYSLNFFNESWYLFLIFILTIGSIDVYFLLNWQMFSLLENEKWDDLILYLEMRIYQRKRIYKHLVKVLINTYLIKSDMSGILKLEEFLIKEKQQLLKKMVISLSVPRFIEGNPGRLEDFFGDYINIKGVINADWVRFLYSFSLLLNNKKEEASQSLLLLSRIKVAPILKLLVIYSLNPFYELEKDEKFSFVDSGKKELVRKYKQKQMEIELDKVGNNVLVLILNKFSKEAITWLYKE
jgi:hypothetical protein